MRSGLGRRCKVKISPRPTRRSRRPCWGWRARRSRARARVLGSVHCGCLGYVRSARIINEINCGKALHHPSIKQNAQVGAVNAYLLRSQRNGISDSHGSRGSHITADARTLLVTADAKRNGGLFMHMHHVLLMKRIPGPLAMVLRREREVLSVSGLSVVSALSCRPMQHEHQAVDSCLGHTRPSRCATRQRPQRRCLTTAGCRLRREEAVPRERSALLASSAVYRTPHLSLPPATSEGARAFPAQSACTCCGVHHPSGAALVVAAATTCVETQSPEGRVRVPAVC